MLFVYIPKSVQLATQLDGYGCNSPEYSVTRYRNLCNSPEYSVTQYGRAQLTLGPVELATEQCNLQ